MCNICSRVCESWIGLCCWHKDWSMTWFADTASDSSLCLFMATRCVYRTVFSESVWSRLIRWWNICQRPLSAYLSVLRWPVKAWSLNTSSSIVSRCTLLWSTSGESTLTALHWRYCTWLIAISRYSVLQGGPQKLHIFQHSVSLEPFKIKWNGSRQNVPRVSLNKD